MALRDFMKPGYKIIIVFLIVFQMTAYAQVYESPQPVYRIFFTYDSGKATIDNITIVDAYVPDPVNISEDVLKIYLISLENELLYDTVHELPLTVIIDPSRECMDPETGSVLTEKCGTGFGAFELSRVSDFVDIPYYPTGANILATDKSGKTVFSADVRHFVSVCGNSRCDVDENERLCQQDCAPAEPAGLASVLEILYDNELVLLVIILFVVLLLGFAYYRKPKKKP